VRANAKNNLGLNVRLCVFIQTAVEAEVRSAENQRDSFLVSLRFLPSSLTSSSAIAEAARVTGYRQVLRVDTLRRNVREHVDLYSALDDKYLVLKALRHGSHSLTCTQHYAYL